MPQQYIKQDRNANREYIVIDINENKINLLQDNDFSTNNIDARINSDSKLFTVASRFMDTNDVMLKNVILRLSISFKVRGGTNPLYVTLYTNSIVQRQNLIDNKVFLKTTGTDEFDKVSDTKVNLRHVRTDI
mgnify:CR=1 FL=1